jgi:quercetin dioxygenase-like cupin family protein
MKIVVPEDLKWIEVPNAGGAQVANVTGDIFKGAYAAFAKVPGGQDHPLHTHSSEVMAVVISGTFSVTPEGGVEKKLGPGSYFSIPARVKHTNSCVAGAPCLLFQQGPGKFDMKPVAEKTAEKK